MLHTWTSFKTLLPGIVDLISYYTARRTLWSGVKRRLVKEKSKLRPGLQELEWKRVKKRLHKERKTRRTSLVQWVDRFFGSFINDVPREDQLDLLILARIEAANSVYETYLTNKRRFDLHHRSHPFEPGDLMLYDWPKKGDHKLSLIFKGPFVIVCPVGAVCYEIKSTTQQNKFIKVVYAYNIFTLTLNEIHQPSRKTVQMKRLRGTKSSSKVLFQLRFIFKIYFCLYKFHIERDRMGVKYFPTKPFTTIEKTLFYGDYLPKKDAKHIAVYKRISHSAHM
ncbi:uncharacterized protein NPIL_33491 [Nephila pilipes]|uniref:Uncharacterized protein n=1 Tax=Nephila pilipes TaxID=299642 RepID=A0A8X6QIH8_NEPPI|nr:uncharacterized protein NPIL_33491 [Nephila pilipes]